MDIFDCVVLCVCVKSLCMDVCTCIRNVNIMHTHTITLVL